MAKRDPRLKAYVKVDKYGTVIPGSLVLRRKIPSNGLEPGLWREVITNFCCTTTTTTSTTTTTTTTSTTTTTTTT